MSHTKQPKNNSTKEAEFMTWLLNIKTAEDKQEAYETYYKSITQWVFSTVLVGHGQNYEEFQEKYDKMKQALEDSGDLVGPEDSTHETKRGPALLLAIICDVICTQFAEATGTISGHAWSDFRFNHKFYEKGILKRYGENAVKETPVKKKRKIDTDEHSQEPLTPAAQHSPDTQTNFESVVHTPQDIEGFDSSSDEEDDIEDARALQKKKQTQTIQQVAIGLGLEKLVDLMKRSEGFVFVQYKKLFNDEPEEDKIKNGPYPVYLYPLTTEVTEFISSKILMALRLMAVKHAAKGHTKLFNGSTLNSAFDKPVTNTADRQYEQPPQPKYPGFLECFWFLVWFWVRTIFNLVFFWFVVEQLLVLYEHKPFRSFHEIYKFFKTKADCNLLNGLGLFFFLESTDVFYVIFFITGRIKTFYVLWSMHDRFEVCLGIRRMLRRWSQRFLTVFIGVYLAFLFDGCFFHSVLAISLQDPFLVELVIEPEVGPRMPGNCPRCLCELGTDHVTYDCKKKCRASFRLMRAVLGSNQVPRIFQRLFHFVVFLLEFFVVLAVSNENCREDPLCDRLVVCLICFLFVLGSFDVQEPGHEFSFFRRVVLGLFCVRHLGLFMS